MSTGQENKCRLCRQVRELRDSHVIPKFVGKWLKETSAAGFLMSIDQHKSIGRVQDLFATKLLCGDCEALLSSFEKYFAETIFYPFQKKTLDSIPVDERIGKFAVSVNLRAMWVLLEFGDPSALEWKDKLLELEEEWRNYILDAPGFVKGKNSHHVIFVSKSFLAVGLPGDPNLIWNSMRTSAFYVYEKFNKAYLSGNMAGIQIISMIEPAELPVSRGTQVYPKQTLGIEKAGIGWGGYIQNLLDFSRDCDLTWAKLTEGQKRMTERAQAKDPNKVRDSEDYKILIEQEMLLRFGRPRD